MPQFVLAGLNLQCSVFTKKLLEVLVRCDKEKLRGDKVNRHLITSVSASMPSVNKIKIIGV